MAMLSAELLRRLPKTELHCHLDGSVRPETLIELGREYRQPMPASDAESLREYMRVDDARTLEDYLARFEVTLSVMQTADALERIAYELAIDAARDGVRYIEVRYAPVLNQRGGLTLEQAVEAPLRGLERAEREGGAMGRVIVTALRTLTPDVSMRLAELAVGFRHRGVVAFDLAGGELGNPASVHAAASAYDGLKAVGESRGAAILIPRSSRHSPGAIWRTRYVMKPDLSYSASSKMSRGCGDQAAARL